MKIILKFIIMFFPWRFKRFILIFIYGYELSSSAYIGFSYIFPQKLKMASGTHIGHLNIAVHLDSMIIETNSIIDRGNWITGFSINKESKHFNHQINRKSELIIGKESAITKNHHIDCTSQIIIGDFVTIAGYNSQFLTHSIDIYKGRQDSQPIVINNYCFVSTGVKILGGSVLPAYSVLAAGAVLNKQLIEEYTLFGGVPAKVIKSLPKEAKYFTRQNGFVY
jgi:acetyltransferase-like isoleucine patch superfamily enzyme